MCGQALLGRSAKDIRAGRKAGSQDPEAKLGGRLKPLKRRYERFRFAHGRIRTPPRDHEDRYGQNNARVCLDALDIID